jgi:hypothetical protein
VWKHILTNGTDWFFMDLPIGGINVLTSAQVRFVSPFSERYRTHDNHDISVDIEFFEVDTISESDLAIIISGVEPTVPYTTEGIGLLWQQVEGEIPYGLVTTTSTGAFAAVDGTQEDQGVTNTIIHFDAIASNGELSHRVDCWSCISSIDNTPAGQLQNFSMLTSDTPQPHLVNIDIRKAPSLVRVVINHPVQGVTFRGTSGSADRTFDLQNRDKLQFVQVSGCPLLTQINIAHPETQSTIEPSEVVISTLVSLSGISVSGWFKLFTIRRCDGVNGILELSNVDLDDDAETSVLHSMDGLTGVDLPSGVGLELFLAEDITGTDPCLNIRTIGHAGDSTLALESLGLHSTDVDDTAIFNAITALLDPTDGSNPHATTTIVYTNTPAVGTLSAPTIALAVTKNITLDPVP